MSGNEAMGLGPPGLAVTDGHTLGTLHTKSFKCLERKLCFVSLGQPNPQ